MKSSLQSQAYQAIRKQIIYADLEPGRKISEKALEEHLAIGRTPIREALIQLRQQELVYTIPQSGTYVSKINLVSAENARFVREQLEEQIMIECCSKLDTQTRIVLETILEEQEKAVKINDERAFSVQIIYFMKLVSKLQEEKVWNWLDDHNTHLERFRWLRVTIQGLPWETIMEQHYDLLKALVDKNQKKLDFKRDCTYT